MQAIVRRWFAATTLVGSLVSCAVGVSQTAQAAGESGGNWDFRGNGGGNQKESEPPELQARASGIRFDESKNGKGSKAGAMKPTATNWAPPPCWFEPTLNPQQFKKLWTGRIDAMSDRGEAAKTKRRYEEGHPYKNWNVKKSGDGKWWMAHFAPDKGGKMSDEGRAETDRCFETHDYWADKGEKPKDPTAIDAKKLAGLAFGRIKVPQTKAELSPKTRSVVNIPTWIWLDRAKFHPVSVSAGLPELGLKVTTTARPMSLHLDPGTSEADVHPASGECRIKKDGSIGSPYQKGDADKTPSCGVTYRHSTPKGDAYPLKATVTWKASWVGNGDDTEHKLPDGVFETTQDVSVKEIQSIN